MNDLISRRTAIDDIETVNPSMLLSVKWVKNWVKTLPPAQPELIEQGAYVRGFEQGRTQGMIDNTIKAEWTNADALDLQQTCNQLATDCISRQAAIDALIEWYGCEPNDIDAFKEIIYNKPPAQPEVIRCRGCKWFRKEYGWNCIEYTVCGVSPTHHPIRREDDFCSYAERRANGEN